MTVFHATAASAASVHSATGVSSSRRTFEQRYTPAEASEVECTRDQSYHPNEGQQQTVEPRGALQRCLADHETDASQAQEHSEPLPSAQGLVQEHNTERRRKNGRQGLHESDLRRGGLQQTNMRPHQANAVQQGSSDRAMQPPPLAERAPRPAQDEHDRDQHH
jgi:hypothetical protein